MKAVLLFMIMLKSARSLHIHLFRIGDLRLHDNPALVHAASKTQGGGILPIFCFDPRIFGDQARSEFGSLKCSPRRAKFVMECVADLRQSLQSKGSGLLVAKGKPEDVCSRILQELDTERSAVPVLTCQEEVCSEEKAVAKAVRAALKLHNSKATMEEVWGSTMYDLDDLPFNEDLENMPNTFTPFRNKVEKKCEIHRPLAIPTKKDLALLPSADSIKSDIYSLSYLPSLEELGYTQEQVEEANSIDSRGVMAFRGGETAALARVKDYIWDKDLLKAYFDTRNGMLGAGYSTKFAPWLAHGCVSPRYIASECRRYENERVENKSTYWVVFELLWRDFFKFFALKHGSTLFFASGTAGIDKKWGYRPETVRHWVEGRTGYPLVDANMRELAATGFMSNRGRQNVCSFLVIDLNQDWRHGADYFESTLLDYDVYSNWGNWCAGAGMTGGRLNRFNIVKQSKDYDQHGDYVRHWLPELAKLPNEFVHEPWKMTQFQQMEYECRLGVDYPQPIIPPFSPKNNPKNKGNNGGNPNPRRGRGQRQDMKSLKQGNFHIR